MFGHKKFGAKILDRKPELAGELDARKLLPMHLATSRGYCGIVKKLLSVNADTSYARDGYMRNPLHVAALKGQVDVLKELVETVRDDELANSKNVDGDTISHLAARDNQTDQTLNFLMSSTTIKVNTLNHNGFTANDVLAQFEVPERLMTNMNGFYDSPSNYAEDHYVFSDSEIGPTMKICIRDESSNNANTEGNGFYLGKCSRKGKKKARFNWLERKKNALMVVASLTATMAFQIGINPPGGVSQDGDKAGFSIMATNYPVGYPVFLGFNTLSFVASLSVILLLVSGLPMRRRLFMWILMLIMWIAITTIAFTYIFSILMTTPPSSLPNGIVFVVGSGMYLWLGLMALLLIGHIIRVVRGIKKAVEQRRSNSSSKMMPHGHV